MDLLASRLRVFTEDVFESLEVSDAVLDGRTFEECTFRSCRFVGTAFPGTRFVECTFEDCELSGASLAEASLHDVRFVRSRLAGVDVAAAASLRGLTFEECVLDDTGWIDVALPSLVLRGGSAARACLQGARLRGADLRDLDLTDAVFGGTDLRDADFRGARGYAIDPSENRVAGMRVTWPDAAALLGALGVRLDDGTGDPA